MKNKKTVLYIWGYGSSPESKTIQYLKESLGKNYNVVSDYYAQYNPVDALIDIKNIIKETKPDIIVASSLGGYLALHIYGIPKVIINPTLYPSKDLKTLKDSEGNSVVPKHIIDYYESYEHNNDNDYVFNNWKSEENNITRFVMASYDEVLGSKYLDDIINFTSKPVALAENQGHSNTPESIKKYVVPFIKELTNDE